MLSNFCRQVDPHLDSLLIIAIITNHHHHYCHHDPGSDPHLHRDLEEVLHCRCLIRHRHFHCFLL